MAGAGVALPQDAMSAVINPASMLLVGNRFDIGMALFHPERQYTISGNPSGAPGTFGLAPGTVASRNTDFGIPHLAYNKLINSRASFGITISGNGGMNTTYPASAGGGYGTFGGGQAGVNLEQLFVSPTYALRTDDRTTIGASLILAYQRFEARGLRNFGGFTASGSANNLTDRGDDRTVGIGLRTGILSQATPRLSLGVAYQSQVRMGKFSKYSDLFAQKGSFDIPASLTGGLAYRLSPRTVVALDTQYIWYSAINSVGNPFANLYKGMGGDPSSLLGGENGPGFGWRNMLITKLGCQTDINQAWTVRGGVSYGRQPIRSSEVLFNILAPGVQEWHYTLGLTRNMGKSGELSFSAMYSPERKVSGPNPLEAPGQQMITLAMHQVEFELGWGKRF